jgi:hypothetical protein
VDVEVKNTSAQTQRYTVQYEDTKGKMHVETFDLATSVTKEFKHVKVDSWKVLKVETVAS